MENKVDYVSLVKKAQFGDKQSFEGLARLAEKRLRVDVFRLTLQHELTQEIIQETLIEMFKVLRDLEDAHRFWPWLYKIALNKVRLHHRKERRRKTVYLSAAANDKSKENGQEVMTNVISSELKEIVVAAMRALKPRQRAVLTMRCYREMDYTDIADSLGCSEFAAKMLFYRAKKTLRKELGRNGLTKGSLLAALVLFGKLTAPSEAAQVSVTAAATKVGLLAGLAGLATTKTGIVSITAAGALAVGTIVTTSGPEASKMPSGKGRPGSVRVISPFGQSTNTNEEYWYYFPEGVDRPMMLRAMPPEGESQSHCQVLQDSQANYYYRGGGIHIRNHRVYNDDLSVFRLPTDSPGLSSFLSQVEDNGPRMQHVPVRAKGLLVVAARRRNRDRYAWVTRHFNALDESFFLSDWPTGIRITDDRDAMHKRGWTYFRLTGQILGQQVSGVGRIPFVYSTSRQYKPWLRLKVVGGPSIVDNGAEARVHAAGGALSAAYEGGSFFKGLARPWMGLHAIDTVRRDAAEQQIFFETKHEQGTDTAEVVLSYGRFRLAYTIELENDVIKKIAFLTSEGIKGELEFSYLQDISSAGSEFAEPRIDSYRKRQQRGKGLLWLVDLAEGSLGK